MALTTPAATSLGDFVRTPGGRSIPFSANIPASWMKLGATNDMLTVGAVEVLVHRQGEPPQPELGGVVHPRVRRGRDPGQRPDEDDRGRSTLDDLVLGERGGEHDGRPEVHLDHLVDLLGAGRFEGRVTPDAGIGDQHVDRPGPLHQPIDIAPVRQVGDLDLGPDLLCQRRQDRLLAGR